jgi:hypothetical protein
MYPFNEVTDIEVVMKGRVDDSSDNSKYYIRFTFKDKKTIRGGECFSFRKAAEKVLNNKTK